MVKTKADLGYDQGGPVHDNAQASAWDLYGDIITVAVLSGKAKKAKV